jgi:HAD superfamily hydrolase (TIGR01509 family)
VSLRAILFDAGNTLLFLDYPRLAPAVARATGVALTAELLAEKGDEAASLLERTDGTDKERASRFLQMLFRLAGVPEEQNEVVRETLLELHRERHLWGGTHPGTDRALGRLRAAGYRLAVVSNSDGRAEEALVALGLRDHFELVVDSQLVGVEKPDPRIFAVALEGMGVEPSEALYVGDLYEVDVVGARRAGLDVILVDPRGRHRERDVRTAPSIAGVADLLLGTRDLAVG